MPIKFTPVIENFKIKNMPWDKKSEYYSYPFIFISPITTKTYTTRKAFPDAELIVGDSGGYQRITRTHLNIDRYEVLQFQERACDIGLTLDEPPKVYANESNKIDDRIFQKCLEMSVKNANYMLEDKDPDSKLKTFPVLHGNTKDRLNQWFKATTKDHKFDGYALPIYYINGINDIPRFCTQVEFAKSLNSDFHFLGNCTPVSTVVFSRIAHLTKKRCTFDSSTIVNALLYGQYYDPYHLKCLRFTKKEKGRVKFKLDGFPPCQCPVCIKHRVEEVIHRSHLMFMHNVYVFQAFTHYASIMVTDDGLFYKWFEDVIRTHHKQKFADELIKKIFEIL